MALLYEAQKKMRLGELNESWNPSYGPGGVQGTNPVNSEVLAYLCVVKN